MSFDERCTDPILEDAARACMDAPHLSAEFVQRIVLGLKTLDAELAGYRATVAAADQATAKTERKR